MIENGVLSEFMVYESPEKKVEIEYPLKKD
jgi:hypothetical protein